MLIPLFLWAFTGVIFLVKPGYEGAYDKLTPRQYAIDNPVSIPPGSMWQEVRIVKTILGDHLIVNHDGVWKQVDPNTLMERPLPAKKAIADLVNDAIFRNPERYGKIVAIEGSTITTDTGVTISLDWSRLALSQAGNDTRIIRILYKIHYLQWLGDSLLNRVLGVAGIILLLVLTVFGLVVYIKGYQYRKSK